MTELSEIPEAYLRLIQEDVSDEDLQLLRGTKDQRELFRLILKNLADEDLELIKQSKDQQQFWRNVVRVLMRQRKRELRWYWQAFELFDRQRQDGLSDVLQTDARDRMQALATFKESEPFATADETRKKIASCFRWFAKMGSRECGKLAELLSLGRDASQLESEVVDAFVAIDELINDLEIDDQAVFGPDPTQEQHCCNLLKLHGEASSERCDAPDSRIREVYESSVYCWSQWRSHTAANSAELAYGIAGGMKWLAATTGEKLCERVAIRLESCLSPQMIEQDILEAFAAVDEWLRAEPDEEDLDEGKPRKKIPEEKRTKAMTKLEALNFIGWPTHATNERQARRWFTQSINDGEYDCEQINRKSFVFNVDQFPPDARKVVRKS